jgi:FAD/FMN-containing dehydrogenase
MTEPTAPDAPESREWLYSCGKQVIGPTPAPIPVVTAATPPSGFPPSIPVDMITFTDWSGFVQVPDVQIARISSAGDVAAVCNWAAQNGYTIRAVGQSHNWSPILMAPNTPPNSKVMLVDTTKLNACSFAIVNGAPLATFGTGITMDDATAYLETLDNGKASPAPGYSFPHMPAPGNLSLGGVLTIGAHGTLVPSGADQSDATGCLSNLIVAFDAIVTDPNGPTPQVYTVRHFERTEADASAFLVHLGRAFVTSVTLRVVPNYYLQLTCLFPQAADLFALPSQTGQSGAQTFSDLLDDYGRVEVLWFPYNYRAFVQCNKLQSSESSEHVPGAYNYSWMYISAWENELIKAALFEWPKLTPAFGVTELAIALDQLGGAVLYGKARDLELYLKDTTLRVTLFGWALQVRRAEVQQVASQFFQQVNGMLNASSAEGKYPINAALEIRCTTVDRQDALPAGSPPPALSASHSVAPLDKTLDTVIWLNVGTITGTPGANEFYTELEAWMLSTWGTQKPHRLRPEWSKAWAYTPAGPWTNTEMIQSIRDFYNQSTDEPYTFDWAAAALARYDHGNLFTNPLLKALFST